MTNDTEQKVSEIAAATDEMIATLERCASDPANDDFSDCAATVLALIARIRTEQARAAPAMEDERAAFEKWLMDVHWLDSAWNVERNCFDDFPAHLAFKAWQAARAALTEQEVKPELKLKFIRFVNTIESRAMAADGPVSPFMEELNAASDGEREQFISILRDLYTAFEGHK